jgi:hypothetical protein
MHLLWGRFKSGNLRAGIKIRYVAGGIYPEYDLNTRINFSDTSGVKRLEITKYHSHD